MTALPASPFIFVGATPSESPLPTPPPVSPTEAGIPFSFTLSPQGETAATAHNLTGKQIVAADIFYPNLPEFLRRDGCNVSPFMRTP